MKPKDRSHNRIHKPCPQAWRNFFSAVLLILVSVSLGLLSLYFGTGQYRLELWLYYLRDPLLLILNILPFLLIALLVWFLSGRPWVSFLITGVFCLAFSFSQYWKLMGRSEPVYFSDITLIQDACMILDRYITITPAIILSALGVIAMTVVLILLRGKLRKGKGRLIAAGITLLLSLWLFFGIYTNNAVWNRFSVPEQLCPWFESGQFMARGSMYPFLHSIPDAIPHKPDTYRAENAKTMLETCPTDPIPQDRAVNVICVMYEAFADLSECTDRITGEDPYIRYHQLKDESFSGHLLVNVFAGGTENTERCVITGYSEIPSFKKPAWSYARYFADQGYSVSGSHPERARFYDRGTIDPLLGFDTYYFRENRYDTGTDQIAGDDILLPAITELCKAEMDAGKLVFSYNVTYQNHGPYPTDSENFSSVYVPRGDLSQEAYTVVNNYLSGVADTTCHMADMVDAFRDENAPVILLFFGDHKPWLGNQDLAYQELGIDISNFDGDGFYNHYGTDYLIWANDSAKALLGNDFTGTGPDISPCFLMNVLFEQCGWGGPSYMKLTDQVRARLPVITVNDYFIEDGSLRREDELSTEGAKLLLKMRQAQYYLAKDSGGELPGSGA